MESRAGQEWAGVPGWSRRVLEVWLWACCRLVTVCLRAQAPPPPDVGRIDIRFVGPATDS